jgi:hypothetical protein
LIRQRFHCRWCLNIIICCWTICLSYS